MSIKLERYVQNPIITPTQNWWENQSVYNPGACIFEEKIYLLYRAQGDDHISRFGKAVSNDGFHFERLSEPVFEADANDPYARIGIEDPRITKIQDTYFVAFTSASLYPANQFGKIPGFPGVPFRIRATLAKTKDFKEFESFGIILPEVDSKDVVLFPEKISGQYIMLHRVYPQIWITYSDDLSHWDKGKILMEPKYNWEQDRIGAGPPPIKTSKGWLLFYHGVDKNAIYRLGLIFLDLKDPQKILYRHSEPIFESEELYEKSGKVSNVVFSCGAIEKDNKFFIYYGAADKVIGLATIEKEKILSLL